MSTHNSFTTAYAANPAVTTIIRLTETSSNPVNTVVKIMAISDDMSNQQTIDMSYILTWNGTAYITPTTLSGNASGTYSWNISGSDASFQITPVSNGGKLTVDLTVINSSSTKQVFF
jgi:hypothetical protein